MRKKAFLLWSLLAAMTLGACSDSETSNPESGETSKIVIKLDFAKAVTTKADPTPSTAIPITSWANIKQIQFMLYDNTNIVKYSTIVEPGDGEPDSGTGEVFTLTDVPTGEYTLVAVANAKSSTDNILTYLDDVSTATATEWDEWNVRGKNISDLLLKYKVGTFGAAAPANPATACSEPEEIFMGSATAVEVEAGEATDASIALKREVSMMRIRLNQTENPVAGVNNSSVDFTGANGAILIYRLPDNMKVAAGTDGGVSATSAGTGVLSIAGASGVNVFNTADPDAADYSPTIIIDGAFNKWRDIIVFPNSTRTEGVATTPADADRKYFIVVAGRAPAGHILANGDEVPTGGATVYWEGTIDERFLANQIREVNLTLRTGGSSSVVPTLPTEYGSLNITVSQPEDWNQTIVSSNVPM